MIEYDEHNQQQIAINSEMEFNNQWFKVNGDLDDFIFFGDDPIVSSER